MVADHPAAAAGRPPPTVDADIPPTPVDSALVERERRRLAERLVDRELVEKVALLALVSIIFGRMLPGVDATPLATAIGVALVILASTTISEAMVRRGSGWDTAVRQFAMMLAVNVGIVLVGRVLVAALTGSSGRERAGVRAAHHADRDALRPLPADPPRAVRDPMTDGVAVVTGAASGIGRATAIRLATDGAIVACLDLDASGAGSVAAAIRDGGGRATAFAVDVTDADAVRAAIEQVVAADGQVEVLVNNAGVPGAGRFIDISFDDWRRVLDVHVDGTFHVTKAVLPGHDRGRSRAHRQHRVGGGLARQPERPVRDRQGSARGLHPGARLPARTARHPRERGRAGPGRHPMLRDNDAAAIEAELAAVRIGRFLEPDEIAATIAFLVGPGGDPFVGQVLSPNGGTAFPG